jgi:ABC-type polysaccharide/polyol phosphate export permease
MENPFLFVTDWFSAMIGNVTDSTKIVLLAGLALLALIVGSFFLLGLGKKAIKKANG